MLQFGIGDIYGNPVGGNAASPAGPVYFGTIQDASVEFDVQNVELRGQNQFPDDVAPGNKNCKGKIGFAQIEISIYNKMMLGDTITTGIKVVASKESHTVPAPSGPYTVQVTQHATFSTDLGVQNLTVSPAVRYDRVTSGLEVAGVSYSVNVATGTYTFAAGDANAVLAFSYSYSSNSGNTLTAANHLMGYGPVVELYLMQPYQGTNGLHLFNVRVGKMSAPEKRDNYMISDFEFIGYPNAAGNIFEWFQITA